MAAVSCGVVDGTPVLDLDYPEDSNAEVDMNVVMTGDGGLVEVQATGERTPLSRTSLDELLGLAAAGIEQLREVQTRRGRPQRVARMRLVLASRNAHKVRELGPLLAPNELVALPGRRGAGPRGRRTPSPRTRSARRAPRRPPRARRRWATTPGIEAAALGGAPGIRSARYAGEHATDEENLAKLLRGGAAGRRHARGVRVRAGDGAPRGRGGRGARAAARGGSPTSPAASGGFGYDPAFVPDDVADGRTMAELDPAEKDAISHRGRAARALMELSPG